MEAKLIFAVFLHDNPTITPESLREQGDGLQIEVSYQEIWIWFSHPHGTQRTAKYFEWYNPQLAYETYVIDIEGDTNFSLDEFEAWKEEYGDGELEAFLHGRSDAVERIAVITSNVSEEIAEAINLSKRFGLPFTLEVEGSEFDVRKAQAVDWDSSSMYC